MSTAWHVRCSPRVLGAWRLAKKGLRSAGRSRLDEVAACGREAVDEDLLTCLQFPAKPVYVQPPSVFSYLVGPRNALLQADVRYLTGGECARSS